ncbi:cupin domain-containing protein [Burkholderia sp. AU19243]|uniref:cupin domain-containing protein n=1 Tax=Burkholderia TaxID=32008 RepID=UPI0004F865B5|nr:MULTISPECIES: cupin domain-containing protein [Burkholderia]AIO37253.1 cupin domain protein [Burkholderia cenocepacia]MBR7962751.1 cupin domain-containing protein [Burkholderia vietnamiensis]AOK06599.1 cupin [Burkholderia latens]MBR8363793.1 cupin domain-containing protein [Burkholderia sp. AU19243]MCA8308743.1 cupin domain-containing protein [Burkholderia sp. AU28942]
MPLPAVPFAESFDLESAFADVSDYWSPKIVAQVNDQYVKVAKVRGQLVWHDHAHEDELFFVVRGHLKIEYEGGRVVDLPAGSMHVVPRGTQHNPVADDECWIVLIEPVQTKHTGDVQSPLTRSIDEQLGQAR